MKNTNRAASAGYEQVLGVRFFNGSAAEAVDYLARVGGYVVVPAAPALVRLRHDAEFRAAITHADLAIPDSGAMVLLWKFLRGRKLTRISGLKYLQCLSSRFFGEQPGVLWVLPTERAREKTASWLSANQFPCTDADFYVAPHYGSQVEDRQLLAKIDNRKPAHVVIGIGSGPQEKLAHYIIERISYRPAIHCIGAALGFLTGDQVAIPDWADRLYLGWLFRLVAQPRIFIPRLARALSLPWLVLRYGERLPPLRRQPEVRRQRSDVG
jgi:exopolysaccharide biosynthesis WecB/TagA/CpsF family protein